MPKPSEKALATCPLGYHWYANEYAINVFHEGRDEIIAAHERYFIPYIGRTLDIMHNVIMDLK